MKKRIGAGISGESEAVLATWLSIVVTIIGLIMSYYFFVQQREYKSLSYGLVASTPLVRIIDSYKDQLDIRYNGTSLKDPYLVILRLENTGTIAIEPQDFIKPVVFTLGERNATRIVGRCNVDAFPKGAETVGKVQENRVHVQPTLLNAGDVVNFHVITSGRISSVSVAGRVKGIHDLTEVFYSRYSRVDNRYSMGNPLMLSALILTLGLILSFRNYGIVAANRQQQKVFGEAQDPIRVVSSRRRRHKVRHFVLVDVKGPHDFIMSGELRLFQGNVLLFQKIYRWRSSEKIITFPLYLTLKASRFEFQCGESTLQGRVLEMREAKARYHDLDAIYENMPYDQIVEIVNLE